MEDILPRGKLKVSSNEAMANSLTDKSTETFWESRDEPRAKAKQLTINFDKPFPVFGVSVHVDNQKDVGVSYVNTRVIGSYLIESITSTLLFKYNGPSGLNNYKSGCGNPGTKFLLLREKVLVPRRCFSNEVGKGKSGTHGTRGIRLSCSNHGAHKQWCY